MLLVIDGNGQVAHAISPIFDASAGQSLSRWGYNMNRSSEWLPVKGVEFSSSLSDLGLYFA
jgi:hypothetical protein